MQPCRTQDPTSSSSPPTSSTTTRWGVTNPRIKTPALDRLAAEGTRFDRAYCPNPTCTPTRASLITGMYPSQHGAWTLGTKLYEDVPVVGDLFQEAGYATGLIGKSHFQTLNSKPGMASLEACESLRNLDFWRRFHGPWYGFEHAEISRNHAFDLHVGQHYAIWMEDNGLANWRDYFENWPRDGGEKYKRLSASRTWELPEEFHYSRWTADRTIAHVERSLAEGRPFLTWASFADPHPFCTAPEPWASMYDPADMVPGKLTPGEHERNPLHFRLTQEPGRPEFSAYRDADGGIGHGFHSHRMKDLVEYPRELAAYYAMVSLMDHHIGRILEALDRLGAADNTLVVFTSDHGHFLGQHGLYFKGAFHYEDMIRVPMIVRWPGRVSAGAVNGAIQSLVDYAPTFLSAAGRKIPGVMTGVDQLGAWTGGPAARDHAIVENHHNATKIHLRTYVNDRYKITVYRSGGDGELFDLWEDPDEVNNLWHEPAAAALKSEMLERLVQAILACEPMRMPRIAGA